MSQTRTIAGFPFNFKMNKYLYSKNLFHLSHQISALLHRKIMYVTTDNCTKVCKDIFNDCYIDIYERENICSKNIKINMAVLVKKYLTTTLLTVSNAIIVPLDTQEKTKEIVPSQNTIFRTFCFS